jgi:hypothetical protein
VIHAWYAERLLDDPGWRGASERPARARVAFFGAVLGIAAVYVLIELMSAGRAILVEVLGIAEATAAASGQRPPTLARAIVVPLLGLMPWLLAGVAARRQALAEAGRSGLPGRPMSVARLEEYLVSLIGLAFGAVALGWLFGLAIDALLGGNRVAVSGSDWKLETASFMPAAVLGLALWAWRWSWVVVQSSADPVSEAGSSIRRTALLAVLAVSIIASVASLGLILYRLFGSLLGIEFGENIVSALSTPVGALVVAAAVATYHGLLVRRDSELRAQQAGAAAATPELLAAVPAVEPVAIVQRTLVLRAASAAELDAAVQMIRAGLPLGTRLDDA